MLGFVVEVCGKGSAHLKVHWQRSLSFRFQKVESYAPATTTIFTKVLASSRVSCMVGLNFKSPNPISKPASFADYNRIDIEEVKNSCLGALPRLHSEPDFWLGDLI